MLNGGFIGTTDCTRQRGRVRETMAGPPSSIRQFKLLKESQLRIEVAADASLRIRLVAGTAEIFGTELPPGNWITLPPLHKLAIFTWNGATIDVDSTTEVEYIVDEEYFIGLSSDLSPHSNVVNFNDVMVFRLGGGPQAPRSALPVGAEPLADPTRLAPASISLDMLHQILGVSYAKEPEQVLSSNVAGFVYITDIDMQRKI